MSSSSQPTMEDYLKTLEQRIEAQNQTIEAQNQTIKAQNQYINALTDRISNAEQFRSTPKSGFSDNGGGTRIQGDSQGTRRNNKTHRHSLVKDEKCKGSYKCERCKMNCIGPRYKCSDDSCKFYLHLECMDAEKERTFQEQKFYLHTTPRSCTGKCMSCDACGKMVEGYLYHCSNTDQVFHPLCFPKLKYCPSHPHGLVKDEKCKDSYECEGCKIKGDGKRYKCSESCKFYLHLECMHAKKERTFQNQKFYLHATPDSCIGKCKSCDACEKNVEGYLYHCSKTDQVFHPCCFPKLERYPSHPHELLKDEKCKDSYKCGGCLMEGTGRRYRCHFRSCNFELHFECIHAEKERTFQEQKFEFLPKLKCTMGDSCRGMSCDTCDKKVNGCVYHCSKTDQVFHPLCFPNYHPSHDHGLVKDENCKDVYKCGMCKMEGTGRRYRCQSCNFQLHFECMHAEKECTFQGQKCELLEKPLPFKNCKACRKNKLEFYKNPITSCDACGERVNGFVYHCSKTGQYFHPTCTKLESKMCFEGVTFVLEEKGTSSCVLCQGMPKGNKIRGWSYVSKQGECIHVCCVIALKNELSNKISKGDYSLPLAQGMKLSLQIKSGCTKSRSKWRTIFNIIFKTLISILTGDLTRILAILIDLFCG